MSKPSLLPRWADVGGAIVEPASGKKDVGWTVAERPPAQYMNWWMNLVYLWMVYLDAGVISHGDKVRTYHAWGGVDFNNTGTGGTVGWDYINGDPNTSYVKSTVLGMFFITFPMEQGERIKSVTFSVFGNGVADITAAEVWVENANNTATKIGTMVVTNPAAAWADSTLNVTDTTIGAGDCVVMKIFANAANIRLSTFRVTYDRP